MSLKENIRIKTIEDAIKLLEENGYIIYFPNNIEKQKKYCKEFSNLTKSFLNAKTLKEKEHFDILLKDLEKYYFSSLSDLK